MYFFGFSYQDSMKDLVVREKPPVFRRQKEHQTHQKEPFPPPCPPPRTTVRTSSARLGSISPPSALHKKN
jgi:hypothetical protein